MGRSLGAEAHGPVATQDVVAPGDATMTATAQIEPQATVPSVCLTAFVRSAAKWRVSL